MHAVDPTAAKLTIAGAREQCARSWKLKLGSSQLCSKSSLRALKIEVLLSWGATCQQLAIMCARLGHGFFDHTVGPGLMRRGQCFLACYGQLPETSGLAGKFHALLLSQPLCWMTVRLLPSLLDPASWVPQTRRHLKMITMERLDLALRRLIHMGVPKAMGLRAQHRTGFAGDLYITYYRCDVG